MAACLEIRGLYAVDEFIITLLFQMIMLAPWRFCNAVCVPCQPPNDAYALSADVAVRSHPSAGIYPHNRVQQEAKWLLCLKTKLLWRPITIFQLPILSSS